MRVAWTVLSKHFLLVWLGQSCPSIFVSVDADVTLARRHSCRRAYAPVAWTFLSKRILVGGDADATVVRRHSCRRACALVAWTFLSKHSSSARRQRYDAKNGVAPVLLVGEDADAE